MAGDCCDDGNCLCRQAPSGLTSAAGPYKTDQYDIAAGTVVYPTDAEPPFAAVALCGGFLNTGPEMASWGPFYASHGIVTIIAWTTPIDFPDVRGALLLDAVKQLKAENDNSSSPVHQKLAGRYGTPGYSMGGGGTTIASSSDATLNSSVGLAPWAPVGAGIAVPTLLLCGSADTVAPCSQAQSSYTQIPDSTPKMMVTISGSTHFNWFGPLDGDGGASGAVALAFQKTYLEGDQRWKSLLADAKGRITTNIE